MDMTKVSDGLKNHVFTPAAKGAVNAVLETITAATSKRGGKALPIFALIGIGVVVGAGAALMLSPATGKEVRAKLMELASKLMPSKAKGDAEKQEGDEAQSEGAKPEGTNSHSRRQRQGATAAS